MKISFPMQPRVVEGFNRSVSIERGPLVFAYSIAEDWRKLRDRGMTADWQVVPKSRWNYALKVNPSGRSQKITVSEDALTDQPFALKGTATRLHVTGRLLPSWIASEGVAGTVAESPVESLELDETITMVPYAAAKLRITSFPRLKISCPS